MGESSAFLLLDAYHLKSEGLNDSTTKRLINEHRLMEKVHLVPHTPLKIGTIRVTFDGLILSPEAAIHPVFYKESGRIAREWDLQSAYQAFLNEEQVPEIEPFLEMAVV